MKLKEQVLKAGKELTWEDLSRFAPCCQHTNHLCRATQRAWCVLHTQVRCWARRTRFGRQLWYRCDATRKPSASGSLPRAKLSFSKIGRPRKGGAKTGDEGRRPPSQQSITPQEKLPCSLPYASLIFKKSKPYCWKTVSRSMKTVPGFLAEPADRWAKNTLVAVRTHPAHP